MEEPIRLKPDATPEEVNAALQGIRGLINENVRLRQQCLDAYFLLTGGIILEGLTDNAEVPTIGRWVKKHLEIFPEELIVDE